MGTNFEDIALSDLMYFVKNDRKTAAKIYKLVQDIHRNGVSKGEGKPERLKHIDAWSRRIDHSNRLVYKIEANGDIHVLSCRGHYEG